MGTRSLTHVEDDDGTVLVTIYGQMDGYPTGMGEDLAKFLRGRTVVNGFGINTPAKASNGMGCLAASLVTFLKAPAGIGGIYLCPPASSDCGEEYTYCVYPAEGGVRLSCRGGANAESLLFDGPAESFDGEAIENA